MPADAPCPCGGAAFATCCQPRHSGARPAETAEALMRSRYAAFARGDVAYLVRTLHPSQRRLDTAASLNTTIASTRWTGLRVLDTRRGGTKDDAGEVEFVAFYDGAGGRGELHERSRFVREAGAWLYVDATALRRSPPKRNDPCWCGSGDRYRRCHGRR